MFPAELIIIGAVLGSLAILLNMLALVIIGKINEKVPEHERMGYLWWGTGILKRYRAIYPNGRLALLFWVGEILFGLGSIAGLVYFLRV
jgi:hypothetical protein